MFRDEEIALCQLETTSFALEDNFNKIVTIINTAKEDGARVFVFPEFAICGRDLGDLFFFPSALEKIKEYTEKLINRIPENSLVCFGTVLVAENGQLCDCYVSATKGHVINITRAKKFDNTTYSFYNLKYFCTCKEDLTFNLLNQKITESITFTYKHEDTKTSFAIRFGKQSSEEKLHVDYLILPKARAFYMESAYHIEEKLTSLSIKQNCTVLYTNLSGIESSDCMYAGAACAARNGTLILRSLGFSYKDCGYSLLSDGFAVYENIEELTLRALSYNLWAFMLKTRQSGYALSLSGGADSALCAYLVGLSQAFALERLGIDKYLETLNYLNIKIDKSLYTEDHQNFIKNIVMPKMLTCVYQASENSGSITKEAATMVAKELGASFYDWSIKDAVDVYSKLIEDNLKIKLSWDKYDLPMQNIQARARLPGIWFVANIENKLLITTSNLSEAVVGYCTMDGDTAGGICPIGGVGKSKVRKINKYIEENGVSIFGKYRFTLNNMSYINNQAPTAELRPGGKQTDESDLMPYVLLDYIRHLFQVKHLSPLEILKNLEDHEEFSKLGFETLKNDVLKYFRLHTRSQWKRQRSAQAFRVEEDFSSLDWWRFPLLTDGLKIFMDEVVAYKGKGK